MNPNILINTSENIRKLSDLVRHLYILLADLLLEMHTLQYQNHYQHAKPLPPPSLTKFDPNNADPANIKLNQNNDPSNPVVPKAIPSCTCGYDSSCQLILTILVRLHEFDLFNLMCHDMNYLDNPIDIYRDYNNKQYVSLETIQITNANVLSVPAPNTKANSPQTHIKRPAICYLLDIGINFIKANTRREYFRPLIQSLWVDIIHRILCYQIKCSQKGRIDLTSAYCPQNLAKLNYRWKEIWSHLIALFKFLSYPQRIEQYPGALDLSHKIIRVLNTFITFGDKFLPEKTDYDNLYYELLRARPEIKAFFRVVEKLDPHSELNDLYNIKTILSHFQDKLTDWTKLNPGQYLSSEQVLQIIRSNYDSLKLILQDDLDRFESFQETKSEQVLLEELSNRLIDQKQSK
eukprot:TRINITY_DN7531_c0_g1_i2.p1 TRINITY_DN7531_c0_g1~~TRINITY_DN7531_c0_g1_i2.p1  ORF type:complete len:405 (+),score=65.24 TRINITY_DN7531_c0_g1_i2:1225-2439(+)